jgi:tagatose 1,6-diphosphate aldolase
MANLKMGKIRGLTQVANAGGTFTVLAMDHRGSFKTMINPANPESVGGAEMVRRKLEMCSLLSKYASAVLLDPIYGAAQCIADGALPGNKGLLVSIEETGYEGGKEKRITRLLSDWSVEKIKRLGASAVKILVYYNPDLKDIAKKQFETVKAVAEECETHDIPLFVEPVAYPVGSDTTDPKAFAKHREELVIETARQLTSLPIDVLKAEFPVDMKYNQDRDYMLKMCHNLDKASRVPWVILSGGVDIGPFCDMVNIACEAGASGFLGGRAIWQEVMPMKNPADRINFYTSTVAGRMNLLNSIVAEKGKPWYKKYGVSLSETTKINEEWYKQY